jgi:hypothetical protein
MKTIKKAQKGSKSPLVKKKPITDMQRDEMGKPVTPKQKAEWMKGENEMIDYKGRSADSYPGGKGAKKDTIKKTIKSKMKTGGKVTKAKSGSKTSAKKCKYGCK